MSSRGNRTCKMLFLLLHDVSLSQTGVLSVQRKRVISESYASAEMEAIRCIVAIS